jgi:hypothetical protein
MKVRRVLPILGLACGLIVWPAGQSESATMPTAFTYQGQLIDANNFANGLYGFQFRLFDADDDGNQVGTDVNVPDVEAIDGYFKVELDFGGDVFDGGALWLEIGVRPGDVNDPNTYDTLNPRQKVTPVPYALHTLGVNPLDIANNAADIDALQSAVSTNTSLISSNAGNIVVNATNITALGTSISILQSAVTANESNIAVNTTDILVNATAIATNATGIATNATGISTLELALGAHGHDDRYYTESELSVGGAQVHWGNLINMPADIADGDNDTQLSEAQVDTYVANNGYISSWADIPDVPADIADGDNDSQLSEAQVDAYVANNGYISSWTNIPDIPADIADGDHDSQLSEAQVDAYVANNGYVNSWADILDIPACFADDMDDVGIGGTGTGNYLCKFADSNSIGNSTICESRQWRKRPTGQR